VKEGEVEREREREEREEKMHVIKKNICSQVIH